MQFLASLLTVGFILGAQGARRLSEPEQTVMESPLGEALEELEASPAKAEHEHRRTQTQTDLYTADIFLPDGSNADSAEVMRAYETQFFGDMVSCQGYTYPYMPNATVTTCTARPGNFQCLEMSQNNQFCVIPSWTAYTYSMDRPEYLETIMSQKYICFHSTDPDAKALQRRGETRFRSLCISVGVCFVPIPAVCLPGSVGAQCGAHYQGEPCQSCELSRDGFSAVARCGLETFVVEDIRFPFGLEHAAGTIKNPHLTAYTEE